MHALDQADLAELFGYTLLKVPPVLRADLAAPEQGRRRSAEERIAERLASEMRHMAVSAPAGSVVRRAGRGQAPLPLPVTEADLPY